MCSRSCCVLMCIVCARRFTEQNGCKIGRITTSGVITEFRNTSRSARPSGIALGSDSNLWFTNIQPAGDGARFLSLVSYCAVLQVVTMCAALPHPASWPASLCLLQTLALSLLPQGRTAISGKFCAVCWALIVLLFVVGLRKTT